LLITTSQGIELRLKELNAYWLKLIDEQEEIIQVDLEAFNKLYKQE